jgi:hypothetical protein
MAVTGSLPRSIRVEVTLPRELHEWLFVTSTRNGLAASAYVRQLIARERERERERVVELERRRRLQAEAGRARGA